MPERFRTPESMRQIVKDYLRLGEKFANPPKVELRLVTKSTDGKDLTSQDVAVSTAMQCYSSKVVSFKERSDGKSLDIGEGTLDAGHHTTRMHVSYTWQIVGASRSVTHDIFHSYPFYNSEQQSQRYVEAKSGNFLVPNDLSKEQLGHFLGVADFENAAYFRLLEALRPGIEEKVRAMYPTGGWKVEGTRQRLEQKINKLCQEVARYVLPIGQLTTFDHTLNEISLLRLFRASDQQNFTDEARYIIGSMINSVGAYDPTIYSEIDQPLVQYRSESPNEESINSQKRKFDQTLGDQLSLMLNPWGVNEGVLVDAARNALGIPESVLSDSGVLKILMDPAKNNFLADVYETGMLDPLTTALRTISVSFVTKLSHTADSQRQRQRRTPGATPMIESVYDGTPDFIVPMTIKENQKLREVYEQIMNQIYADINTAIKMGIRKEKSLLLLPNATTIRVVESGDLFDWLHRWKQRLCFTAQEEICFISMEQVSQLIHVMPNAAPMLLAPCGIRKAAGISPRCPEGERWCGQPVYNWQINKYKENRLI